MGENEAIPLPSLSMKTFQSSHFFTEGCNHQNYFSLLPKVHLLATLVAVKDGIREEEKISRRARCLHADKVDIYVNIHAPPAVVLLFRE